MDASIPISLVMTKTSKGSSTYALFFCKRLCRSPYRNFSNQCMWLYFTHKYIVEINKKSQGTWVDEILGQARGAWRQLCFSKHVISQWLHLSIVPASVTILSCAGIYSKVRWVSYHLDWQYWQKNPADFPVQCHLQKIQARPEMLVD